MRLYPVLLGQLEGLQPAHWRALTVDPVVAVERDAKNDLAGGDLGPGVAKHGADPADGRDRPRSRSSPVIVIAHQPHLVGDLADSPVVLREIALVIAAIG